MSRKVRGILLSLLALVLMVLPFGGCAPASTPPPPAQPEKLLPCDVSISEITTLFGGEESVSLGASLKISNPNPVLITVENLNYSFYGGDEILAGAPIREPVYIPANAELIVRLPAAVITLQSLVLTQMMFKGAGCSAGAATAKVLPFWKGLGGALPKAAKGTSLEELWEKSPGEIPYKIEGGLYVTSEIGPLEVPFSLEG